MCPGVQKEATRVNRRIKTALKAELRSRAEAHLGTSWEDIVYRYRVEFLFEEGSRSGTATVVIRSVLVCTGFGSSNMPDRLKLSFPQIELFES